MRFYNVIISLAFLLSLVLSCRSAPDEARLIVKGSSDWFTQFYLNGQPAFIGYGEFTSDVTPFSLNGKNILSLAAQQYVTENPASLGAQVFTFSGEYRKQIENFRSHQGQRSYNANIEFNLHTKKKIWEISQQIKELTGSDRKSILNLVNKLCVILNSRNIDALKKFEMYDWNLDNNRPKKVINRDLIKNLSTLFENADYSVENSSIKDLKFFEGTKIILLLNNHGNILRIAPKKGTDTDKKWHKEFCILRLHFLKIDGKWVMLNLLNDNLWGG